MTKCWMVPGCQDNADTMMIAPDGKRIGPYCHRHASESVEEMSQKIGQTWTTEPLSWDGTIERAVNL